MQQHWKHSEYRIKYQKPQTMRRCHNSSLSLCTFGYFQHYSFSLVVFQCFFLSLSLFPWFAFKFLFSFSINLLLFRKIGLMETNVILHVDLFIYFSTIFVFLCNQDNNKKKYRGSNDEK